MDWSDVEVNVPELAVHSRIIRLERQVQESDHGGLVIAHHRLDRGDAFAVLVEQPKCTRTRLSVITLDLVARAADKQHPRVLVVTATCAASRLGPAASVR